MLIKKVQVYERPGGLVKPPTLAQVVISLFMGSSPKMGPVLTALSLQPASDSVSLSLPLPPCAPSLSFSL